MIWYKASFSLNVKTNVGKLFFKILRKNFPKTNSLSKIFNKNTVKISYSCTRNVKYIISGHNKQILYPKTQQYGCNCRDKNNCPLDNKYLTPKIIKLMLPVTLMALENIAQGLQKHLLKVDTPFNNEQHKNKTELSKYVCSLKNENKAAIINWKIMKTIYSKATSEFCILCLMEKFYILNALGDERYLNKIT